jgi:hypothetical protein
MVKIARSVDNAMYFNLAATNDVEHKVGLDDQDTITVFSESRMTWYPSQ